MEMALFQAVILGHLATILTSEPVLKVLSYNTFKHYARLLVMASFTDWVDLIVGRYGCMPMIGGSS